MIYNHGYGCHMNGPFVWDMIRAYSDRLEVVVISFDMQGHGYSEGPRGLVSNFDDFGRDVVDFLELIHEAEEAEGPDYHLCDEETLHQAQNLPFFLTGESMGAAVSILASLQLPILPTSNRLCGLVLAAPGVQDPNRSTPPWLSRHFSSMLKKAPSLGNLGVPRTFTPTISGEALFIDPKHIEHFNRDHGGVEAGSMGLAHAKMRAQTAAAFVEMFETMSERLRQVDVPILIFHDPEDSVTAFTGSEMILQEVASTDKLLIPVEGGLHCPHVNKPEVVMSSMDEFFSRQLLAEPKPRPSLRSQPSRQLSRQFSHQLSQQVSRSWTVSWTTTSKSVTSKPSSRSHYSQIAAMSRWGAPKRTAPQVTLVLLMCQGGVVLAPFWVFSLGGDAAVYLLLAIAAVFLLAGFCMIFAAGRSLWRLRKVAGQTQPAGSTAAAAAGSPTSLARHLQRQRPLHLVCVPIYKEPDEMILATIARLDESDAAKRMRVVFAMEAATDRPEERFQLYRKSLRRVPEVCYYVHPVGHTPGEIRGLCSNLAYALAQDVAMLGRKISRCLLTKVDSQVLLPPNYFTQLEQAYIRRKDAVTRNPGEPSPVVWQPQLVHFLNREFSHGPLRALGAMRSFSYPAFFGFSIMTVTCYSLPLLQYVQMGLHHPSYMGEDWMVLAQSAVSSRGRALVEPLPVLVAVAPPLDSTFCGAWSEGTKQCIRWAAQSMEVAEFRWRFRPRGGTLASFWWMFKYWLFRILVTNGLGVFALCTSIAVAIFGSDLSDDQLLLVSLLDKLLLGVVLALILVMPLYEQYLFTLLQDPQLKAPMSQLPVTILSTPGWLFFQMVVDYCSWWKLLLQGKEAITLTHRKKKAAATNTQAALQQQAAVAPESDSDDYVSV